MTEVTTLRARVADLEAAVRARDLILQTKQSEYERALCLLSEDARARLFELNRKLPIPSGDTR